MPLRVATLALILALCPTLPALAQGKPTQPSAAQAPKAEIDGFRSARFGMTEAEVRSAIQKDFGLKGDSVKAEENTVERTRALVATVPDVLPGGGKAAIAYIFGYASKKLMQVNVQWSTQVDASLEPKRLLANGQQLVSYFAGQGFEPGRVVMNQPLPDGRVLLFRGADAKGRVAQILVGGPITEIEKGQHNLTPEYLQVSYIRDAANPDIFRLKPGTF